MLYLYRQDSTPQVAPSTSYTWGAARTVSVHKMSGPTHSDTSYRRQTAILLRLHTPCYGGDMSHSLEIHRNTYINTGKIQRNSFINSQICHTSCWHQSPRHSHHAYQSSKLGFYVSLNSLGHIGTGSQHCHLWDSNHTEVTACD